MRAGLCLPVAVLLQRQQLGTLHEVPERRVQTLVGKPLPEVTDQDVIGAIIGQVYLH